MARNLGIHQSQVSRIVRGKFKTRSEHVMQICIKLNIDHTSLQVSQERSEQDREAVITSALALWDGSHRHSRLIVGLLDQMAKLCES